MDIFQRRHTDGQQARKKKPNITNQGNASQNHNEISRHICHNGFYQKKTHNKYWRALGENGTLMHCWW